MIKSDAIYYQHTQMTEGKLNEPNKDQLDESHLKAYLLVTTLIDGKVDFNPSERDFELLKKAYLYSFTVNSRQGAFYSAAIADWITKIAKEINRMKGRTEDKDSLYESPIIL